MRRRLLLLGLLGPVSLGGSLGCTTDDPAVDEGKACTQRSDCEQICADLCSDVDGGSREHFHCTSFSRAVTACLCGVTADGGVLPVGC